MEQEYYGYYNELNKLKYEKILDINNIRNINHYEFIVLITNDSKIPESERSGRAINHSYIFNIYNTDFSRKVITIEGWSIPSQFETNSAFNPSSVYLKFIDRFNEEIGLFIDFSGANTINLILNQLNEMAKYYDISHYKLLKENQKLKNKIKRLEKELETLENKTLKK